MPQSGWKLRDSSEDSVPNIVRVFEWFESAESFFLIMQAAEGFNYDVDQIQCVGRRVAAQTSPELLPREC